MAYVDKSKLMRRIVIEAFRWGEEYDLSQIMGDIEDFPESDVVRIPNDGIGELSDGYHTFNELYHHRAVLFSVICNSMPDKAWKSKLHDTGDMFDGMFIVGIETPEGQATYHYDIEPYWDMFKVKELEKAPKWDDHTPDDAINRIEKLSAYDAEVKHGHFVRNERNIPKMKEFHEKGVALSMNEKSIFYTCSECREWISLSQKYCSECGAKMDGAKAE